MIVENHVLTFRYNQSGPRFVGEKPEEPSGIVSWETSCECAPGEKLTAKAETVRSDEDFIEKAKNAWPFVFGKEETLCQICGWKKTVDWGVIEGLKRLEDENRRTWA